MGFVQNLTLGSAQLEVTHWESTPNLSPSVSNTVIVLGVLTFALQLCLVLFFVLRCWRSDRRVRRAVEQPDGAKKLMAPLIFHMDSYKPPCYTVVVAASARADEYQPSPNSVFAPSIPWDLVQG